MTSKPKALVSWSSGKDSAWALHLLRQQNEYEIVGLLTTVSEAFDRVAMHAVRRRLLEAQADAVGLPLWHVPLPSPCSNQQYEAAMTAVIARARSEDITAVAFGDLFLADIRAYRERQLSGTGLNPLFPLWLRPTAVLAEEMISAGVRAFLTCVDSRQLSPDFAGRPFDRALLRDLPTAADPCGENGEFHTFVFDGPMLRHDVPVHVGEVVTRDGFVFADLEPAERR